MNDTEMQQESDANVLLPLERNLKNCALNTDWYANGNTSLYARPRGITFYVRAHNEESTIGQSIESLHTHLAPRQISYNIVVIDNNSSDQTNKCARKALRPTEDKIVSYAVQVAKPGLENALTPPNSAHSFVWFTQFALQQCTRYSHAFRWDADFMMTAALAKALQREFASPYAVPNDFYSIRALHCASGKENREYYLIAVRTRVRYALNHMWEAWLIPCKCPHKATLADDACIEHVASTETEKAYQTYEPWWRADNAQRQCGSEKWFCDMVTQYEQIRATLPSGIPAFARSHCRETDILQRFVPKCVKRIQGLPD